MKHLYLLFTTLFAILAAVNSFSVDRTNILATLDQNTTTITPDVSDKSSDGYRLYTSTNTLELLINNITNFGLFLDPKFHPNVSSEQLVVRFRCEEEDAESFNWNVTDSGCNILDLTSGYEYRFGTNENKKDVTLQTLLPGKQQVVAHFRMLNAPTDKIDVNAKKAYITVNVGRAQWILTVSSVIGWIYFAAWSISFYPQLWDNFRRRSVVGLNFDFLSLNITGFLSYSMFNVALYFIPYVQHQYDEMHPRSQNPVQVNDVVFALHACFATFICIFQCCIYERGQQVVSIFSKVFLTVVYVGYVVLAMVVAFTSWLTLLNYLYILSYVKLTITIIKYIPQAYYNYQRKSTVGWSIGNIFLDFTGGLLSMFQMFLLAYNYDDWVTIFNNFTKFGLGFISILFDVLFLLQHYVFYRHSDGLHDSQSSLINGSIGTNSSIPATNPKQSLFDANTKVPRYT